MRGKEIAFDFEVEVIGGEEGRQLRLEQARAIREILMWLHENRAGTNQDPNQLAIPPQREQD